MDGRALRGLPEHQVRQRDEAQMVGRLGRSADAWVDPDVGRSDVHCPERFPESDRDFLLWASGAAQGQRVALPEPSHSPKDVRLRAA